MVGYQRGRREHLTHTSCSRACATDKIESGNSQINKTLSGIKQEIVEISKRVDDVESMAAIHEGEVKDLRSEVDTLKIKLSEQAKDFEKNLLWKEMHDRKTNLLFYGIQEVPNENSERVVRTLLSNELHFSDSSVENIYFKAVHRLPRKPFPGDPTPNAPAPIIASFLSISDRDMVLNASRFLKGKRMSIRTDLPAKLKKQRAILYRKSREIFQSEKVQTRVRQTGIDHVLETRANTSSPWVKRTALTDDMTYPYDI